MFFVAFVFGESSVKAQSDLKTVETFSKLADCINQAENKYEDSGNIERNMRKIRRSFDFIRSKWLGTTERK